MCIRDSPPVVQHLSCLEQPRTGPRTPGVDTTALSKGAGSPAGNSLPNEAQKVHKLLFSWLTPAFTGTCSSMGSFDLAFPFFDLQDVFVSMFLQSQTCGAAATHSSFLSCKLAEEALCPTVQLFYEDVKHFWPQYQSPVYTSGEWPPGKFVWLIIVLSAWQFRQFSVQLSPII